MQRHLLSRKHQIRLSKFFDMFWTARFLRKHCLLPQSEKVRFGTFGNTNQILSGAAESARIAQYSGANAP